MSPELSQRTLLLVDDEENIVRALARVLRRDAYNVLTSDCGATALALLADNPQVGVIISDQRMPAMSGSEFLAVVKERYPDTVRIMLSGYTELASVTDAINRGAIYKFLTKPWDDDLLRANIAEAFEQYELRSENRRLSRELARANQALAERVECQTRVIDISQRVLDVSREVLERLPVGVVGIGDDGVIAVANSRMHALLGAGVGTMIGRPGAEALPALLADMVRDLTAETRRSARIRDKDCRVYGAPLGATSPGRGCMLVVVPEQQGP